MRAIEQPCCLKADVCHGQLRVERVSSAAARIPSVATRPKPGTRHTDPTGRKRSFASYDKLQPMTTGDKWMGKYFKARASINGSIRRLDGMPWVLRITCLASLCTGLALLVISIFQIGSFRVNDETLPWGQIRAAGYYPFLVISGLAMAIAGIGMWMRRGWSRWFVVLLYVFPIPIEIIYLRSHSPSNGLPWSYGIEAVVWAGLLLLVSILQAEEGV